MKKFLIIRFSSIGDIVLTTPVVRALKEQLGDAEIHYITKSNYAGILEENPYIDKVIRLEDDLKSLLPLLKAERYDWIIDLHKNLRSKRIKIALGRPSSSFPKLNIEKFLLTRFKKNRLPDRHIVERYFDAVKSLGVENDQKGLDYFIHSKDIIDTENYGLNTEYTVFSIGAQFATKRMPTARIIQLINKIEGQVVLLGGPSDSTAGEEIEKECQNVVNLCGKLNLNQSASVIQQSHIVVSHDTGLMHIASAFNKRIVSIWGNTVPEFGMYPYQPQNKSNYTIHQVELNCRPCSKIGYQKCPKKHFNCMEKQDLIQIAQAVNSPSTLEIK